MIEKIDKNYFHFLMDDLRNCVPIMTSSLSNHDPWATVSNETYNLHNFYLNIIFKKAFYNNIKFPYWKIT